MKKKFFYCLSILLLILLLGFACQSESDDDDADIDDDDDDGNDDDDDIADDDDDDTPEPLPFTYDNLEFETIATTDGFIRGMDLALNSQGKAGICLIDYTGETDKHYYISEQADGTFTQETLEDQLRSDCAILFDQQERPVILFYENTREVEIKVHRKEIDGQWTQWNIGEKEGHIDVVRGSPSGFAPQFFINGLTEQIDEISDAGWQIVNYTRSLIGGDAYWGCGEIFLAGVDHYNLISKQYGADGSFEGGTVESFSIYEKELHDSSVANNSNCEPLILLSLDENPPPDDADDERKDDSIRKALRLYRQNSSGEWEYSFVMTNSNYYKTDMLIDGLDSIYIAHQLRVDDGNTTKIALSLAVGTWENFEFVTLYDQVENGVSAIKMKADPQNRLHFLFAGDYTESVIYGRPALD